jgi:uncharacterized damage-inducible protein DinB
MMASEADLTCRPFRQMARNARLANARLDRACMALQPEEWDAPRTSFFPSLKKTMVHLLNADRWYVESLRGDRQGLSRPPGARETPAEFAREREQVDDWYVAFCESLTASDLVRTIPIPMPERPYTETVADTLLHIFLHGTHHRGQIHAMLAGTSVPPPQLDEFIMSSETELRAQDLAALGWSEDRLAR